MWILRRDVSAVASSAAGTTLSLRKRLLFFPHVPLLPRCFVCICVHKVTNSNGSSWFSLMCFFLNVVHLESTSSTACRPLITQNWDRISVRVSLTPLCFTFSWLCAITNLVKCYFRVIVIFRFGNLAEYGSEEFWIRPLHNNTPSSSLETPNCSQVELDPSLLSSFVCGTSLYQRIFAAFISCNLAFECISGTLNPSDELSSIQERFLWWACWGC